MAYFGKAETPEDAIQRAPADDVEKHTVSDQEAYLAAGETPAAHLMTIDPVLERRVLRKLDLRVPTLMAFFCMLPIVTKK